MKLNKAIIYLLLILAVSACENPIKFEEPQPVDQSDLKKIPKRLRGNYQSDSGDTFLSISDSKIIEWSKFAHRLLIDSLDIDSELINEYSPETVQLIEGKYNLTIQLLPNDSVLVDYFYADTIFDIRSENLLRKFKGHYFLNYQRNDDTWRVRRLTLKKKELSFGSIRIADDIEKLKAITEIEEIKSDSGKVIGYQLNPTRKELKQLMKLQFREGKKYHKVKIKDSFLDSLKL